MQNTQKINKLVEIFNKQVLEVINQSLEAFPHLEKNPKITNLINSIKTTISISPEIAICLFLIRVS